MGAQRLVRGLVDAGAGVDQHLDLPVFVAEIIDAQQFAQVLQHAANQGLFRLAHAAGRRQRAGQQAGEQGLDRHVADLVGMGAVV